jgi:hypothetical protein
VPSAKLLVCLTFCTECHPLSSPSLSAQALILSTEIPSCAGWRARLNVLCGPEVFDRIVVPIRLSILVDSFQRTLTGHSNESRFVSAGALALLSAPSKDPANRDPENETEESRRPIPSGDQTDASPPRALIYPKAKARDGDACLLDHIEGRQITLSASVPTSELFEITQNHGPQIPNAMLSVLILCRWRAIEKIMTGSCLPSQCRFRDCCRPKILSNSFPRDCEWSSPLKQ